MTRIRRPVVACALLGLAAAFSAAHLWGEPSRRERTGLTAAGKADDLADPAANRFTGRTALAYRAGDGKLLFAWQVQPTLAPAADRPRDLLVLVDTSASQVGTPLLASRRFVEELVKALRPEDRLDLWTLNTPAATKSLSRGLRPANASEMRRALDDLKAQVPLGATDLPGAFEKALAALQAGAEPGRQRAVVWLGDGMSTHEPLTAARRAQLCGQLAAARVAVFPVPLGPRFDPNNLHGLATGTGGRVVRMAKPDQASAAVGQLLTAVSTPVLYPADFRPGEGIAEAFPTKLPPLRPDVPTLVVGAMQDGAKGLSATVAGTAADGDVRVELAAPLPADEPNNAFLAAVVDQWRNAKDQPALMQADRILAFSQQMAQLARAELVALADTALAQNRLDEASRLLKQAKTLDPENAEAAGTLTLVEKLKSGALDRERLRALTDDRDRVVSVIEKDPNEKGRAKVFRARVDQLLAQAAQQRPAPEPAGAPASEPDLLRRQRQRQAVEEQRTRQEVDNAIREASRLVRTDADAARDLLKRVLTAVNDNPGIGDDIRRQLASNLENKLRSVDVEGAAISRERAERLRGRAQAEERIGRQRATVAAEDLTMARMRVFHNLMNQGRAEDAYRVALAMQQDAISQGAPVPVAATAAYGMGLVATNLRDVQELRRVREERYLLTMMQVEKSHVPFPDEPPVQFPPAATWRELTAIRKERYESSGLTDENPVTLKRIQELKNKLENPVTLEFESGPLKDALGFLQERYNLPILVDTEAFKSDLQIPDVDNQQVKLQKVVGISLGTVLRLLLAQVQGTFIIRREFIEVTTAQRQAAEKALRVYPVADLVIPIPNGINQNAVNQAINNSILGAEIQLTRAATFLGGGVGLGGALGIGLGGGGLGGLGGGGGVGGLGGAGGLGGLGGGIGGAAGLGGNQAQNLGVGGGGASGFAGFGGQLGQFGNLGGQFGLQGGDQSAILIRLIRQVVGEARDWSPLGIYERGPGVGVPQGGRDADDENAGDPNVAGAIGYYPPARALVVKQTSRVNTRLGGGLLAPRQGPAPDKMGALDPKGVKEKFAEKKQGKDVNKIAAADLGKGGAAKMTDVEATKVWQDALEQGVNDPGLIIAVADALFANKKFEHAAEFLKAELRQGIVARPWVYEALALALKQAKGSPDEIERAQLSAADLEPQDARNYLKAARALADNNRYDRALAFCRQAALLEPNLAEPYAQAVGYADAAKDTAAMEWAAGSLLARDWPADNDKLHKQARDGLVSLAGLLKSERREADAERLAQVAERAQERDLVIHVSWQGQADCDVDIREPVGTRCTFQQRQTPGGGILLGNTVAEPSHETYALAEGFPGTYEVTVRKLWGEPLGRKVTVEVIEHQGTARETRRRETVTLDGNATLKVALGEGRRTTLARVPRPAVAKPTKEAVAVASTSVLTKLRAAADPDLVVADSGIRGGMAANSAESRSDVDPALVAKVASEQGQVAGQERVTSVLGNVELAAQATVTADRRYVRLSLAPVFQSSSVSLTPTVNNPAVPGMPAQ